MSPSCLAGLLSLTVSAPLPQRPVYQWKFEPDRTFFLEVSTDTRQEMTVSGQSITQTQTQVFTFGLTPERQLPDGTWLVRQRVLGVRMNLDIGGNRIVYDSALPSGPADNPLAEFFKSVVGAEFRLRLERTRGIVAVEGRDEFLRRLGEAKPEMKALLQTILTEEALKEMNGQTFTALPEGNVSRGESWERRSRLDLGPVGAYDTTHRYTYTGSNGTHERFKVEVADFRYQPPAQQNAVGLPFKIVNADLRGGGREGEMLFDRTRGRVARFEARMKLEGSMTVEIGGQETKVYLKQEQRTTVRTLDVNPLGK